MLVLWGKDRASVRVSVLWRETQTLVLCTKNSVQKIFQRLIGNIRGSRNSKFKECKCTKMGIATGIFRGVLWNFPEYFFKFWSATFQHSILLLFLISPFPQFFVAYVENLIYIFEHFFLNYRKTVYWIRMYFLCTSNPATLEGGFRNDVGSIPAGGNSSSGRSPSRKQTWLNTRN